MMSSKAELAHVIDQHFQAFNDKHKLPAHKLRVIDALAKCRTSYMGGHVEACEDCGEVRTVNNSCRNRHCPKCGSIDKEKWVMAREKDLLPVKYFHIVFTVPDKLNKLFMVNQRTMYNLLFTTAWGVLKDFGADEKWIGGRMGATMVLHTWGQNLQYHPHVHCIVPAGALMDKGKWKNSRSKGNFLFKADMVRSVYRARFVKQLREMLARKTVQGALPHGLFDKDWVVYAKEPFNGAESVIQYLGRYTHRTAISNDRILKVDDKGVTFRWKDYRQNYKQQVTTLSGERFLQLFCMHILPHGYTRIRHYGFLSSAAKTKALALIREHMNVTPMGHDQENSSETLLKRMGICPGKCRSCGGDTIVIELIAPRYKKKRAPPGLIPSLDRQLSTF